MKNLIILLVAFFCFESFAAKNYIVGTQKVTFRTGPGTDNKIIKMLVSDDTVTVLEVGETWTKVTNTDGAEGYVLNRFLTKDVPVALKYKWLRGQFEKQKNTIEALKTTKKELALKTKGLETQLSNTSTALDETKKELDELKVGSADYIGLKTKYDTTVKTLSSQTNKVETLESQISIYYIKWFLAGSGVLVLGWLLGLMSRKKKSYSGISL